MMKGSVAIAAVVACLCAGAAQAANVVTVTGKVTKVTVFTENHQTYNETQPGLLTIWMDELPGPAVRASTA